MFYLFVLISALSIYVINCSMISMLTKRVNSVLNLNNPIWLSWLILPVSLIPVLGIFGGLFIWWFSHVQFLAMPLKNWVNENEINEELSGKINSFYQNLRGIFLFGMAGAVSNALWYSTEKAFFALICFFIYISSLVLLIYIWILCDQINNKLTLLDGKK